MNKGESEACQFFLKKEYDGDGDERGEINQRVIQLDLEVQNCAPKK